VLVTDTEAEAADYLADPESGLTYYYSWFLFSFSRLRKALFMVKDRLEMPDEDVTVDTIKRALIIAGSPRQVLDQLVSLREETGHFGTLLMGGHDWDQPRLWRRSMELLATEVMPRFAQHAAATRPK
jgi:alkanesulfonate monooxygenase SsuD/methylene tetrahydromethanopterin reductase-like flavin-dependent oxidoreductase (luciferase family)